MTLITFKLISAFTILFITILGGIWPFINKSAHNQNHFDRHNAALDFPSGEALASGIFLGVGLLHMLPDSTLEFSKDGYHYPFAFLITTACFLFLLLLEHVSVLLHHRF